MRGLPFLWVAVACGAAPVSAGSTSTPTDTSDTATPTPAPYPDGVLLRGATILGDGPCGGLVCDVWVSEGKVQALGPPGTVGEVGLSELDLSGRWLVPAFIDSHVHLAYLPEAKAMLDGGIAGAVDLAAPVSALAADPGALRLLNAGPMVTAVGGYPTQSWGRNGYGLEVADALEATAAVTTLAEAGARVIKSPVDGSGGLDDAQLAAIAEAAHQHNLKLAVHALGTEDSLRAARAGADVLAHTPTVGLTAATTEAWAPRAVITTLAAFGGGATTVANLAALHAQGATVLYGTDFGNTRSPGISGDELRLMGDAGMSPDGIIASGTSTPASFWGMDELGSISVGKAASWLVLQTDPRQDIGTLTQPEAVWIDGQPR